MADPSSQDAAQEELQRLLENEENYFRMLVAQQHQATGVASDSASSATTTPGLLDTAFLNETNADDQNGQISLSAAQSQTTRDASSTVYRMINTILERQPETIRLSSSNREMVSTGTMPRTPVKMVSLGTMPQTPTGLTSTGTMPGTPTMTSTGTLPKTPTALTSTGTMPGTPTMVSTGTMPKTPTRLATATTSFSLSDHGTIELGSPRLPVIDHVSPGSETIDLCSPETPTNTDLPQ